ncbi:glucosylceramidase [Porphyromonadaceae bacterium KH3R12]|nr:glucosylceramidase [Porphyromonadaceae bacterium KH3R12]
MTGHFSKFIDRGAWRIHSSNVESTDNIRNVAFLNPDGSKVMVVLNNSDMERVIEIQDQTEVIGSILPARSTATYKWSNN